MTIVLSTDGSFGVDLTSLTTDMQLAYCTAVVDRMSLMIYPKVASLVVGLTSLSTDVQMAYCTAVVDRNNLITRGLSTGDLFGSGSYISHNRGAVNIFDSSSREDEFED